MKIVKVAAQGSVDDYHPYRGGTELRNSMIAKKNLVSVIQSHKKSQNKFQHDSRFESLGLSGRRNRKLR